MKELHDTAIRAERAFVVGVRDGDVRILEAESLLRELSGLADTLGVETVGSAMVVLRERNPAVFHPVWEDGVSARENRQGDPAVSAHRDPFYRDPSRDWWGPVRSLHPVSIRPVQAVCRVVFRHRGAA